MSAFTIEGRYFISEEEHCLNELDDWNRTLDYYEEKTAVLEDQLMEIREKSQGKNIQPQAGYFHDQFLVQKEQLGHLKQEIRRQRSRIENAALFHIPSMARVALIQDDLNGKIKSAECLFRELKNNFYQFIIEKV